jgi:hypothetical protein
MDPIVVDVELNPADWDALQRHLLSRFRRQMPMRQLVLNAVLGAIPALTVLYFLSFLGDQVPLLAIVAGVLVATFSLMMLARRARTANRPTPQSSTWAPTRFEIDATGIRVTREHQVGLVDWRGIQSVDETEGHVFVPLDRLLAYMVPKRQIVSMTPEAFVTQLRQWHAERRGQNAPPLPDAAPATASNALSGGPASDSISTASAGDAPRPGALRAATHPRGFWSDLRSNLLIGMRAFFFRPVQPAQIISSFDQVAALLVILLAVVAILDRATAGADAELDSFGVYTWIMLLLMGLWTCAFIARAMSERADTRALLVVALATAPWVIIATTLLSLIPALADNSDVYGYAVIAIVLWSSLRTIRAAYGSIQRPALIVIAVSLMVFAVVQNSVYFSAHLWTEASDDDEDVNKPTPEETEAIFFEQQARLDEAIEKLEPQRPGVTDLYYVGFAGDAYQRVFRRETLLGQRVFAERLGTGPRSLELINDYQDRESFPLATPVSLRYALSEIGKVMDPNEDVLVLFLTSHGSREGGVHIRNGVSWIDNDLPPDEVRSALDDAGIRWRIVIVSACYSGVFVEPLKTDTTMILTAADSQHTSFGCADDRPLTYFGEAFLQDALPKAASLEDAFEQARSSLTRREKMETLSHSNPTMWVGASMARKLVSLGPLPLGQAE